ncbi:MAG: hypothetical protein H6594_07275 [Flavobacteriales bacterium]|nr:hypothetical protein [Flavobacteriales bacterium]
MQRLPALLALAAIVAVVMLMVRLGKLEDRLMHYEHVNGGGPAPAASAPAPVKEPLQEVAPYMGRIQNYLQKYWLSVKAGNEPLAYFYVDEIEESMEAVEEMGLIDKGIPISAHMRTYGLATIKTIEKHMKEDGLARAADDLDLLVNTCNSCHERTGHDYINIQLPTASRFSDQRFEP